LPALPNLLRLAQWMGVLKRKVRLLPLLASLFYIFFRNTYEHLANEHTVRMSN
jgi:hypothetical protein